MSLDDFKTTWAAELGDLSVARITTLWKKSKTMANKDIAAAIATSRAAATKDQMRRGKVTHESNPPATSILTPGMLQTSSASSSVELPTQSQNEVVVDTPRGLVESEVNRRWSASCAQLNIDQTILTAAIKKLYQCIMTKDISASDRDARVTELYECVDQLMSLCHKHGPSIDVLKALESGI